MRLLATRIDDDDGDHSDTILSQPKQRCLSVCTLLRQVAATKYKLTNERTSGIFAILNWKTSHIPTLHNSLCVQRKSALSQRLVLKQYIRSDLSQRPVAATCFLVCPDLLKLFRLYHSQRQLCVHARVLNECYALNISNILTTTDVTMVKKST